MMLNQKLLDMLVCPVTKQPLKPADESLVGRLNAAIGKETLKNVGGETVTKPLTGGLIREDARLAYPIVDSIPVLLADEGIPLDEIDSEQGAS